MGYFYDWDWTASYWLTYNCLSCRTTDFTKNPTWKGDTTSSCSPSCHSCVNNVSMAFLTNLNNIKPLVGKYESLAWFYKWIGLFFYARAVSSIEWHVSKSHLC
ncbi:unnamed protein product [Cuscuta epithymum]|uniref:Uncharacterized protein n=1 Tax=Cuscuta epithymum TaxID=186058 RepID=A0AAV0GBJ4_9ASTE|nr:unnamed protein product [Cuscuta epithymum]